MKVLTSLLLVFALGMLGVLIVACGDDSDDDNGGTDGDGDSDGDGDTDSEMDSEMDTESESVPCGDALEACCDDSCNDGLDPIIGMDQSCTCQAVCTFAECTAGDESGYCTNLFVLEETYCYNESDFPADASPNDCTVGDTCTTDSGDDGGICVALPNPNPAGGDDVNRCIVACDGEPEGCDADTVCTPAISIGEQGATLDYSDGHCGPAMM